MGEDRALPLWVVPQGSDGAKLGRKAGRTDGDQVLLCPELFQTDGGIARVSRLYLQALSEMAAKPLHLVVLNDSSLPPASLARYGGTSLASAEGCSRSKWRFMRALMRACGRRAHMLSTHVHLLPAVWLARVALPRLQYDVVAHGIEVWQSLPPMTTRALQGARRIFCVSNHTRDRISERHPGVAARLRVVPNALDPGFPIVDCAPATEAGVILTVSRLAAHDQAKGIDHLIEAMPVILQEHPQARLRIVGDGADRNRLEALAAGSVARERITFLGHVDEPVLREEFARCQLFALPSRKEGFGLVFLEALAHGKPCVGARAGGIPEVIGPDCGLLPEYGDVPALAAACRTALRRTWDTAALLDRARSFSYPSFRDRLREAL